MIGVPGPAPEGPKGVRTVTGVCWGWELALAIPRRGGRILTQSHTCRLTQGVPIEEPLSHPAKSHITLLLI